MSLSYYNGFSPKLRDQSWVWLKSKMASGEIPPPGPCQECGEARGHLDYHTEDYSRPFGPHIYAYRLCFRCHMALHARFRNPSIWRQYIDRLEAGAVYEPLWSRKEISKVWVPGWVDRPVTTIEPRGERTFFRSLTMDRVQERPEDEGQIKLFL